MAISIKVGETYKYYHYIAGAYTWHLIKTKSNDKAKRYALARLHKDSSERSLECFATLKEARLEFQRQMFCVHSEYFDGFSHVV